LTLILLDECFFVVTELNGNLVCKFCAISVVQEELGRGLKLPKFWICCCGRQNFATPCLCGRKKSAAWKAQMLRTWGLVPTPWNLYALCASRVVETTVISKSALPEPATPDGMKDIAFMLFAVGCMVEARGSVICPLDLVEGG